MMRYAADGKISFEPLKNGIEITDEQYAAALTEMLAGKIVKIIDGKLTLQQPEQNVNGGE
ncbi:hypothetical protein [Bartonella apis]|uniref:hypothetical protein n=1 Tax=Bartonella apis TaxID=1686310 RepID=UPI00242CF55D|nr:hypothetical protein [Bartonella apis]